MNKAYKDITYGDIIREVKGILGNVDKNYDNKKVLKKMLKQDIIDILIPLVYNIGRAHEYYQIDYKYNVEK